MFKYMYVYMYLGYYCKFRIIVIFSKQDAIDDSEIRV